MFNFFMFRNSENESAKYYLGVWNVDIFINRDKLVYLMLSFEVVERLEFNPVKFNYLVIYGPVNLEVNTEEELFMEKILRENISMYENCRFYYVIMFLKIFITYNCNHNKYLQIMRLYSIFSKELVSC